MNRPSAGCVAERAEGGHLTKLAFLGPGVAVGTPGAACFHLRGAARRWAATSPWAVGALRYRRGRGRHLRHGASGTRTRQLRWRLIALLGTRLARGSPGTSRNYEAVALALLIDLPGARHEPQL